MLKLSVIVAIYNLEKYVSKCVQSIIEQTYKNLEILLIDDGSTDSTAQILDEFAKTDTRIKVVHKENGGCTSARKLGVEMLSGDAFTFVDGDDLIDADMYENMICAMEKYQADIVSSSKLISQSKVLEENILPNYLLLGDVSICNKIFIATEKMRKCFCYEEETNDVESAFDFYCQAKKWAIIPGAFYNYRQDNVSYCRSPLNLRSFDNVRFTSNVAEKTKQICHQAYNNAYMHVIHAKFDVINKVVMRGFEKQEYVGIYESVRKQYVKDIRKNIFKCLKTSYFSKNEKKQLFCIWISYKLFVRLKKRYLKKHDINSPVEAIKC